MDVSKTIEANRTALSRVVAEILALLQVVKGERLSHRLYRAVNRLLQPAESAVRRLIVIAAHGLVVKVPPKRAMPKGLVIKKAGGKPMQFRLYDARKSFEFIETETSFFVRVKTYSDNPFNPLSRMYQRPPPPEGISAAQIFRRIAAVTHALETIPRQAIRMARWKARRKLLEKPSFTSPLRSGPPPGHRERAEKEIDFILQKCHWLAWDALKLDSS